MKRNFRVIPKYNYDSWILKDHVMLTFRFTWVSQPGHVLGTDTHLTFHIKYNLTK